MVEVAGEREVMRESCRYCDERKMKCVLRGFKREVRKEARKELIERDYNLGKK